MDEKLLREYLIYAKTDEAAAVLFAKKHLSEATKGHWIDISGCRQYEKSAYRSHFRFVAGRLYKRKIQPQYPSKLAYMINGKFDERGYSSMVRAITWKTAHEDIEQQKLKNLVSRSFKITGISYDKNRDNKNFFREDAPLEIKALASDLYDRTNPLWDKALKYANKPEFVYEIKNIFIESHYS
jgi:hypothetical protein